MVSYAVGQVISKYKDYPEGTIFELSDEGATLMAFFSFPRPDEIEQFKAGHNFEIRFTELYGVIMLTFKIGDLNWMEAPYTPHLSSNLTKFQLPNENQGLSLTLMLIDTNSGKIKAIRLVGLSEKFTKKLFGTIMDEKMKDFDVSEYDRKRFEICQRYTTKQIANMSSDYCKIR